MFAPKPCTRTTGSGCAALGLQDQSLAPAGGVSGEYCACAAPVPITAIDKATAPIRSPRAATLPNAVMSPPARLSRAHSLSCYLGPLFACITACQVVFAIDFSIAGVSP